MLQQQLEDKEAALTSANAKVEDLSTQVREKRQGAGGSSRARGAVFPRGRDGCPARPQKRGRGASVPGSSSLSQVVQV